jgi:hypothetical protein
MPLSRSTRRTRSTPEWPGGLLAVRLMDICDLTDASKVPRGPVGVAGVRVRVRYVRLADTGGPGRSDPRERATRFEIRPVRPRALGKSSPMPDATAVRNLAWKFLPSMKVATRTTTLLDRGGVRGGAGREIAADPSIHTQPHELVGCGLSTRTVVRPRVPVNPRLADPGGSSGAPGARAVPAIARYPPLTNRVMIG